MDTTRPGVCRADMKGTMNMMFITRTLASYAITLIRGLRTMHTALIAIITMLAVTFSASAAVIRVKQGVTGGNGSSWTLAYGDLQTAIGWNPAVLLDHFVLHGLNEGRQASAELAPAWYLGTSPGVEASLEEANYHGAIIHFFEHGQPAGWPGSHP